MSTVNLIVGGSGLIGRQALPLLLRHRPDAVWVAAQRKPVAIDAPNLRTLRGELTAADVERRIGAAVHAAGGGELEAFICCLGTTQRTAGSAAAFIAVDRDLVLRMARLARELGARQALLVSSVGAGANARSFYLRIKGETEAGVVALGFDRCDFLRPGLLLGTRDEQRPMEQLAQGLAPWLNPVLCGALRRYRAIDSADVAAALVALCGERAAGRFVHYNAALIEAAERLRASSR